MRVLITGGAGCLGSSLVERCLSQGYEVMVIDNFVTGKREVLPPVSGLTVVEGSVAEAELVERSFAAFAPTHVVHAAAAYKAPEAWDEDARTNTLGTIHVIRAAERHAVRRLVYLQTALSYGRPERVPIPVDHPTRPFTSYGASKLAGETYVSMASVPWASLRLANVTGPRLAIGPIPTFYQRLQAGKQCFCTEAVRDFLDMEDFLSLMDRVTEPDAPSGIYNVSTGEGHSIEEVFRRVATHLGLVPIEPVPMVPPGDGDVPAVVLDPSVTEAMLGWRARVGFADTIDRVLRWYDAHGVSDIHSHLTPASG